MRLNCPACGASLSLDAIIGHEGARDAVMTALALPAPLGKLLVQYLALFRPAQRTLSMDRVANLLGELLPMIESARVERNGRVWAAPQESWRLALDELLAKRDRLTLPLKSHGYLLEVIAGMANKVEAKQETQREQQRAYAFTEKRQTNGPVQVRSVMPDSVRAQLQDFTQGKGINHDSE